MLRILMPLLAGILMIAATWPLLVALGARILGADMFLTVANATGGSIPGLLSGFLLWVAGIKMGPDPY